MSKIIKKVSKSGNIPLSTITPKELLQKLAALGLTNDEIAPVFGLSSPQFADFLFYNPDIADLLTAAKDSPNRQVEAALFKRALGYPTQEVHKVEGRPAKVILKSLAPDVVACIFWLKNRMPKQWRDTLEVRHTLRDSMDRAHTALRRGSIPTLGTKDEALDVEAEELKS